MTTCAACGGESSTTRRAIVLRGPADGVPGDVCPECADLGWLFVFGDDWTMPVATQRKTKGRMLEKVGFGLRELTRDEAKAFAPRSKPAPARSTAAATKIALSKSSAEAHDETIAPLPPGQLRTLIAIAQHSPVTRAQLTTMLGFKKSTRDRYVYSLRSQGLIDVAEDGRVLALSKGVLFLGDQFTPLPTGRDLLFYWLERLPPGERTILDQITRSGFPLIVPRDAISDNTGYQKSTRDRYIYNLITRGLVSSTRAGIQAVRELFG